MIWWKSHLRVIVSDKMEKVLIWIWRERVKRSGRRWKISFSRLETQREMEIEKGI